MYKDVNSAYHQDKLEKFGKVEIHNFAVLVAYKSLVVKCLMENIIAKTVKP